MEHFSVDVVETKIHRRTDKSILFNIHRIGIMNDVGASQNYKFHFRIDPLFVY